MGQGPAAVQHHGLRNQGATCYLNGVLQVLFMTEDFREAVDRHARGHPGTECIDLQLKRLFDELQRDTANTREVTDKLGINNVYEQRDAAEYFEKILSLTSRGASQIFHGKYTHRTTCLECHKHEDADGYFWHLPLRLPDSSSEDYNVAFAVEQYFQTSHLNGENQMYCDVCDSKSDATIKCVMKHHPEVLTLLLKRFDLDYSYMMYMKNYCAVDVPYTLQIPENQRYELYAAVEHVGDLRGGHYTAVIKSQDGWYKFNDNSVTSINPLFQGHNTERSSSFYLLFYKKTKTRVAETCTHGIIRDGSPPATGAENAHDTEEVMEQGEGEERTEVGSHDSAEDVLMDTDDGQETTEHFCGHVLDVHPEKPEQNDMNRLKDDDEDEGGQKEAEQHQERVEEEEEGHGGSHLNNYSQQHKGDKGRQRQEGQLFLTDGHLKEGVENQDSGEAGENYIIHKRPRINHEFKVESSDRHGKYGHLDKEGEMREEREEREESQDHGSSHQKTLKDGEDRGQTGLSPSDGQLEDRVEDQDSGEAGENDIIQKRPRINYEFKVESSDRHGKHGHLNKEDEMREESQDHGSRSHQKTLMDGEDRGQTGLSPSDGQLEDRVEDQDCGVRQMMQHPYQGWSSEPRDDVQLETSDKLERHGNEQDVGQNRDPQPVSVDTRLDELVREMEVRDDRRGQSLQDTAGAGDSEREIRSAGDLWFEQGDAGRWRQERTDGDQAAKHYTSASLEDEDEREVDGLVEGDEGKERENKARGQIQNASCPTGLEMLQTPNQKVEETTLGDSKNTLYIKIIEVEHRTTLAGVQKSTWCKTIIIRKGKK